MSCNHLLCWKVIDSWLTLNHDQDVSYLICRLLRPLNYEHDQNYTFLSVSQEPKMTRSKLKEVVEKGVVSCFYCIGAVK